MVLQSRQNKIHDSNIIRKIEHDKYRIRVDIDTRIAGVDEFIISRNDFFINCFNYVIRVENYVDFSDILESSEHQLLDAEYNPYKIRQIIRYIQKNERPIESIVEYYRQSK